MDDFHGDVDAILAKAIDVAAATHGVTAVLQDEHGSRVERPDADDVVQAATVYYELLNRSNVPADPQAAPPLVHPERGALNRLYETSRSDVTDETTAILDMIAHAAREGGRVMFEFDADEPGRPLKPELADVLLTLSDLLRWAQIETEPF